MKIGSCPPACAMPPSASALWRTIAATGPSTTAAKAKGHPSTGGSVEWGERLALKVVERGRRALGRGLWVLRGVVVAPIFTSSAWKWVASLSSCRTQRQLSRSCTGWSAASVSKRGFEAWPCATVMARRVVLAPHLSEESSRGHDGDRRHAAKHGPQRSQQAQGGSCSRKCNLLKKISPELPCESGTCLATKGP